MTSIYRFPRRPMLSIDPHIEFGLIVLSNRVVTRQAFIYNRGSCDGEFALNYAGQFPVSVSPTAGRVHRNSAQAVKVRS